MLRQRNKQTSSISLKALKLAVFLEWAKPPLRIPFGTTLRFPNPSAVWQTAIYEKPSMKMEGFFICFRLNYIVREY